MVGLSFELTNASKRVLDRTKNMSRDMRQNIRKGMFFMGRDLVKTAQSKILDQPKTGEVRIIRRGKTKRRVRHRASAPGEAPANLSGGLRRSIGFNIQGHSQLEFGGGKEGSDIVYARPLELGNPKGNLKKRPYLIPSIKENFRNMSLHLENNIKKGFKL